jgi:hypothetical protein
MRDVMTAGGVLLVLGVPAQYAGSVMLRAARLRMVRVGRCRAAAGRAP